MKHSARVWGLSQLLNGEQKSSSQQNPAGRDDALEELAEEATPHVSKHSLSVVPPSHPNGVQKSTSQQYPPELFVLELFPSELESFELPPPSVLLLCCKEIELNADELVSLIGSY